jgi:hypothetical protein
MTLHNAMSIHYGGHKHEYMTARQQISHLTVTPHVRVWGNGGVTGLG